MQEHSYRLTMVELIDSYAVTTTSKGNSDIKDNIMVHYNN
jgi:hypothetical protein